MSWGKLRRFYHSRPFLFSYLIHFRALSHTLASISRCSYHVLHISILRTKCPSKRQIYILLYAPISSPDATLTYWFLPDIMFRPLWMLSNHTISNTRYQSQPSPTWPCDVPPTPISPTPSLPRANHDQHCPLCRTANGPCFHALLFISVARRSFLVI